MEAEQWLEEEKPAVDEVTLKLQRRPVLGKRTRKCTVRLEELELLERQRDALETIWTGEGDQDGKNPVSRERSPDFLVTPGNADDVAGNHNPSQDKGRVSIRPEEQNDCKEHQTPGAPFRRFFEDEHRQAEEQPGESARARLKESRRRQYRQESRHMPVRRFPDRALPVASDKRDRKTSGHKKRVDEHESELAG